MLLMMSGNVNHVTNHAGNGGDTDISEAHLPSSVLLFTYSVTSPGQLPREAARLT